MLPDDYPSRAQGNRGTCAAFVACVIREIAMMRSGVDDPDQLSPEFVYWHRDNKPAGGMYGRAVMKIMQRWGISPEHLYEYGDVEPEHPPSPEAYAHAMGLRISRYARVNTIEGLKLSLFEAGAAYLLLPLYRTRPEFWIHDGPLLGCHAVAVIGYDKVGFKLKNSWGENWNGDGCVTLPYEDWFLVQECWTALINYDDDQPGRYNNLRPSDPLLHAPLVVQPAVVYRSRQERLMSEPSLPSYVEIEPVRRNSLDLQPRQRVTHNLTHSEDTTTTTEEAREKCIIS